MSLANKISLHSCTAYVDIPSSSKESLPSFISLGGLCRRPNDSFDTDSQIRTQRLLCLGPEDRGDRRNNNNNVLFTAPHLVRARKAYKDIRTRSFYLSLLHTHPHTHCTFFFNSAYRPQKQYGLLGTGVDGRVRGMVVVG